MQQATQQIENRYGFDQNVWRNAKRKVSAPRVEIFFDNTNPKPGEKVTAHAVPEFFKNDSQNLYYTWYIIHANDRNIRNGKIEASKLMSRGDYDPNLDGQNYADPGGDPDNDGWPAVDANSYHENEIAAPMGGSDGVGGLAVGNDNIEPYTDANDYCRTRGDHSTAEQCNLYTATSDFNRYYNLTPNQSGDYCTSCQQSLTFSATLSSNNQCCYLIFNPSDPDFASYDPAISYCPSTYVPAYESCFDYAGLKNTNKALTEGCLGTAYQTCLDNWNDLHINPTGDEPVSQVSRCYKHNFGINNPDLGFRGYSEATNSFNDDSSGIDVVVDCKHKWRNAPGYTSGSGKFPTGEEDYWKTDPFDPDTDGDGFPDEADVIGLGQESFTWNYRNGDRVGVVVEGTSMLPIDEKSAYFKIMWGYPDVCDSTKTGLIASDDCDSPSDYGYGFLATKSPSEEGDDKLKVSLSFSPNNPLADPSDANQDNILDDGTISNADQIFVISSLSNTNFNPNDLYYTWQIQKGDPQSDNWGGELNISDNFNTTSPSAGMGISQFSFTPKKSALSASSGINYFKVTLTVGTASDLTAPTGRGRSSVIIPVNTKGVKITLHKVEIENEKAVVGEEICTDGLYKSLCPVVKGQMLAAQVSGSGYTASNSEFLWKVNGSPLYIPANASQLFDGWNNTTVFFPITKEEQGIEDISVTATSKDQLEPATGTRLTTVVHPALFIKSSDTNVSWPKTYTAEDTLHPLASYTAESSSVFEALTNSGASYELDFVPYYLLSQDSNTTIDWSVNGTSISSPDFYTNNPSMNAFEVGDDNQTITLPTGTSEGTFIALAAEVKKYWSDDERSIAYTTWGVAPNTLSGNSSINIETVAPIESAENVGAASPGQILAAIGTHLPHYFMYLLRLVLTMAVMFIVSAGFYGVTQRLNFADEEK
ncbi:MAG: hypothetical protein V1814_03070 [Candidatus Moraniibacteriota bacterium]